MALKLQTPATAPAISLADAKLHLRVDSAIEDTLIESMVAAATLEAEHLMGRALMPQKWLLSLEAFASTVALKRPPVAAVDWIKHLDPGTGMQITLDPAAYQLVNVSDYAADVIPAYGQTWPGVPSRPGAVQILFSAGYADAASVPAPIVAWIKLRIGALYEHREAWTVGQKIEQNAHVDYLLDRYRSWMA